MIENKVKYIANRYISRENSPNKRFIDGYHILKDRRITQPFTAFYPKPNHLYKNHWPFFIHDQWFLFLYLCSYSSFIVLARSLLSALFMIPYLRKTLLSRGDIFFCRFSLITFSFSFSDIKTPPFLHYTTYTQN